MSWKAAYPDPIGGDYRLKGGTIKNPALVLRAALLVVVLPVSAVAQVSAVDRDTCINSNLAERRTRR
jgi:hypothetical protein